jgi:uncharacterized membrane protein
MRHLEWVETLDRQRSHWVAKGPMNITVAWDAELINERENELIAWRSLPGSDIETAVNPWVKIAGRRSPCR